ncbi:MAG: ATP-binding protein [Endomicrobium sp.]|jgi:hypothetical protein|nr:ATP-binding protein [Endomicrobium sp.]
MLVKFAELIKKMHTKAGERVVILVDEYDKSKIESLNKAKEVDQEIKERLHNFYQVIKGNDEHIKFMFMTGVPRLSGLSIFSGLNNLNDITMNSKYAGICGYTQEELESNFKEHIGSRAEYMGISKEELLRKIKYVKEKGSKIERKVKEAMDQIKERKYYEKYINRKEEVALLGIVFGEGKEIRCKFESLTA